MFMTKEEYNETLDLFSGKEKPGFLLRDLKLWAKDNLQIEVYNYLCDYTINKLWRLRLVLWDPEDENKMHDGPNYDKSKQRQVAKKFAELARLYQVHPKYWNEEDIFVCCETIRDEIQMDILKRARADIKNIQIPDLWRIDIFFTTIHIFYETDAQIECNKRNGVSDYLQRRCTKIVKKYDVYNAFADGASCIFSSWQTVNEKFEGNMFYYYR